MGFKPVPAGRITLPGPVDPARLLYCELEAGALETAKGEAARRLIRWAFKNILCLKKK